MYKFVRICLSLINRHNDDNDVVVLQQLPQQHVSIVFIIFVDRSVILNCLKFRILCNILKFEKDKFLRAKAATAFSAY